MIDRNNPVYREIRDMVERRLGSHRAKLESLTCAPEKTAELRGRIDELKKLLDWNGETEA